MVNKNSSHSKLKNFELSGALFENLFGIWNHQNALALR